MADEYIRRDDALKGVELFQCGWAEIEAVQTDYIERLPAADVAPVRHGRWIDAYPDVEPNPMFMYGICSECGFEQGISKYLNYCPNCGARMDGGNDNG